MKVKIDTREKFHVITLQEPHLAANMSEQMDKLLLPLLETDVKNVIVNLQDIDDLDKAAASHLLKIQHHFYEVNSSFVICSLSAPVKRLLDDADLLDQFNHTPTESEAMDIVQMEEIERELGNI